MTRPANYPKGLRQAGFGVVIARDVSSAQAPWPAQLCFGGDRFEMPMEMVLR
jgi:hypothetical protein